MQMNENVIASDLQMIFPRWKIYYFTIVGTWYDFAM